MPTTYKVLGQSVSSESTRTLTNKKVETGGIVTLTTSVPHKMVVGQVVTVSEPSLTASVTTKAIASTNVVTLTTSAAHRLIPGSSVTVSEAATISVNVTNRALTGNVATLTVASHRFTVGSSITVAGIDAVFNGTYTVAAVTATTISYSRTNANVTSTASSGTITGLDPYTNGTFTVATTPTTTTFTYSVANSFGITLNATSVTASATYLDAAFNGTFTVEANPSSTEFSYTYAPSANLAVTASTGSAVHEPWMTVYTCPAATSAVVSSLVICNQTASKANYQIAVSPDEDVDRQNIIQWNGELLEYESITFTTGITLDATNKYLMVGTDIVGVSVTAFGMENS